MPSGWNCDGVRRWGGNFCPQAIRTPSKAGAIATVISAAGPWASRSCDSRCFTGYRAREHLVCLWKTTTGPRRFVRPGAQGEPSTPAWWSGWMATSTLSRLQSRVKSVIGPRSCLGRHWQFRVAGGSSARGSSLTSRHARSPARPSNPCSRHGTPPPARTESYNVLGSHIRES